MITRKSAREIQTMQKAGKIVAETLELLASLVEPGIPTKLLDQEAEKYIRSKGATPAFKGYRGFPASICTSINEEIVHGIPSNRKLQEGDILSIDIGVRYQGYIGDAAKTFPVGKISKAAQDLLRVCEECLYLGIQASQPGNHVSDISEAIQTHAEQAGYSVVKDYTGHGIGLEMHEDPQIPNYVNRKQIYFDVLLKPGYCIAIEPMVNMGVSFTKAVRRQGWDVVITRDKKWSAHFEHSIAILADGPLILTSLDNEKEWSNEST